MHDYYYYTKEELLRAPGIPLRVLADEEAMFCSIADEMLHEIMLKNELEKRTVFICPVGPVGQYSYFVEMVNKRNICLRDVWFINMDEYLTEDKQWIDIDHPLSFRGYMEREVYAKIKPELLMPKKQRIFPDPKHLAYIPKLIEKLGGVDIVFGGVGINGHIAFNEPQEALSKEEFLKLQTRVLEISRETRTVNAISDLNGGLDDVPNYCVTVGIHEIAKARKIRLACFRGWHSGVVRRIAYGEPSSHFPVSLLRSHNDITLTLTELVAGISLPARTVAYAKEGGQKHF